MWVCVGDRSLPRLPGRGSDDCPAASRAASRAYEQLPAWRCRRSSPTPGRTPRNSRRARAYSGLSSPTMGWTERVEPSARQPIFLQLTSVSPRIMAGELTGSWEGWTVRMASQAAVHGLKGPAARWLCICCGTPGRRSRPDLRDRRLGRGSLPGHRTGEPPCGRHPRATRPLPTPLCDRVVDQFQSGPGR